MMGMRDTGDTMTASWLKINVECEVRPDKSLVESRPAVAGMKLGGG